VVALAVLGVGLMLAGSILVQAHRTLARAGVEARAPVADLALARLRAELGSASGLGGGEHLELIFPDGRRVRYEHFAGVLRRRDLPPPVARADESGASGRESGGSAGRGSAARREWSAPRRVLDGVTSWRWRRVGSRLVTVEIAYRSPAARGRAEVARAGAPGEGSVRRTVVTALRGGGLGWGW
jgi:hypothetical protein